ncbi:MAG: transglutaminase domain-containing protein [Dehalococcoidia bacterium]
MRIAVEHRTEYRFSAPVFLEPHEFRFRPRSNAWQRLDRFDLLLSPEASGSTANLDVGGNEVLAAWFTGLTDHLTIDVRFEVQTLRTNPFDFVPPHQDGLPMDYVDELRSLLLPYTRQEPQPALREYAEAVSEGAAHAASSFAADLARRLHTDSRHVVRPEGAPRPPEETLRSAEGACRDLATLYVALCREVGLAARFVSGYCLAEEAERDELHAWAEVYLPGGGWRGFDPSTGLAVADRHVAVAAGPDYTLAAPVSGQFRGEATADPLHSSVTIRRTG